LPKNANHPAQKHIHPCVDNNVRSTSAASGVSQAQALRLGYAKTLVSFIDEQPAIRKEAGAMMWKVIANKSFLTLEFHPVSAEL
jgi:hypothetical protein